MKYIALFAVLFLACGLGNSCKKKDPDVVVKTDTLIVRDTIRLIRTDKFIGHLIDDQAFGTTRTFDNITTEVSYFANDSTYYYIGSLMGSLTFSIVAGHFSYVGAVTEASVRFVSPDSLYASGHTQMTQSIRYFDFKGRKN